MKRNKIYCLLFCFILLFTNSYSQNEASKWCFGNQAGLNFMTNPPSVMQSSMNTTDGCSSIADAAGNLLFYTNGATVWNQQNQVMANGTGLSGEIFSPQNSIIIKQPGNNNIYYIFYVNFSPSLHYATVDMSLAAGMGSVTSKNNPLLNYVYNVNCAFSMSKISATKHCNGTDIWVVAKQDIPYNNLPNSFFAYLLTAAGVNTTAVISAGSTSTFNINNFGLGAGCMKFSPGGTKIGMANPDFSVNNLNPNANVTSFVIWDFNSGTGAVTNSLALTINSWGVTNLVDGYGCEFSPDGSKFYGSSPIQTNIYLTPNTTSVGIGQWDLCAGSPAAIAASLYTVASQLLNQ